MMTTTFRFLVFVFVAVLAFTFTHPALAHGDEPRLDISVERINPGGVIEVRGVDFEIDELVTLELMSGSSLAMPLGEITADVEGLFAQIVTLPVDLQAGTYYFRATTDDHVIMSSTFEVWGTAILDGGEDGQREEEDGLYAPMPTYAPGVSVTPMTRVETEVPTAEASSFPWTTVFVGASVVIMLFLVLLIVRRRRVQ